MYSNRASGNGGGVLNSGTLTILDSTLAGNVAADGGGVYNATGATLTARRATFNANTATANQSIANSGAASVGGSILTTSGTVGQCADSISTNGAINLAYGAPCSLSGVIVGNPGLAALRDNGGPTLTYAIAATSPAVNQGYAGAPDCTGQQDQRGRTRPAGSACDLGAYEYGPRTLTVDSAALADPAALLFGDLQSALDAAMTGDVIEIRAGAYTGNFTAYRDVTIRHAGGQVSKLSPELGYDLRAILQASSRTPQEQKTLDAIAGTTLTVQGYAPTSTSIQPTGDVTVNLEGLTIRYGAGDLGGGVHNLGQLTIDGSTIEGNAATGESGDFGRGGGIYNAGSLALTRSTLSGNRAEQYGGGLYNAGPASGTAVTANITASTVAYNLASRLPDQLVVAVRSTGLTPQTQPLVSGDEVRFETQDSQAHTMEVRSEQDGVSCEPRRIEVPRSGLGLSVPLVCTTDASVTLPFTGIVTVEDPDYHQTLTLHVSAPASTPDGASLFQTGQSNTRLDRSIVYSSGTARPCARFDG